MKKLAFFLLAVGLAACPAVEIPQAFSGESAGTITPSGPVGGTPAELTLVRYSGDGYSILYPRGWLPYEDEETLIFDSDPDDLTAPYIEMYIFEVEPMPVGDFTDQILFDYLMWFDAVEVTSRGPLSGSAEMFMAYYESDGVPLAEFSVTMTDPGGYALIASYVCGESRWEEYDGVALLAEMLASLE